MKISEHTRESSSHLRIYFSLDLLRRGFLHGDVRVGARGTGGVLQCGLGGFLVSDQQEEG